MITLSLEKGIVQLESWEDVVSRPGFTANVDPKAVKLKSIIGAYSFGTYLPCGLSTCHQPHGTGFLVVIEDGRETNIGRICGKKHFSVEFTQLSRAFIAAAQEAQHRELLWQLKHRLPHIKSEIEGLRHGTYKATWIASRINSLIGSTATLSAPITNAVREAIRRNDGTLIVERAATEFERGSANKIIDASGRERRGRDERFVRQTVGQLEGFAALAPDNSLRRILVDGLDPFIATLEASDIDSLSQRQLRDLSRAANDVDPLLDRLRTTVAAGQRLLTKQNIQQLKPFAVSKADQRCLAKFLTELP